LNNLKICALVIALSGIAIMLFYGQVYSLHQDLSGGLLTAGMANALQDEFSVYNSYFPPMESFWYGITVQISKLTGIGAHTVIILQTFAAVVFSAFLGFRIRQETNGTTVSFFIVPVIVFLVVPVLFKNVFGLREHFIVLGLWPYLVLRAAPYDHPKLSISLRATLGLWMGFTLLFKFLYSVVVVVVEIANTLTHRRLSQVLQIECVIAGVVVFTYLMLWLGIDPTQREAIASMRSAISGNLLTTPEVLEKAQYWVFASVLMSLFAWVYKDNTRNLLIGFSFILGAFIVAWMQARWYAHHLFPILMALIGCWWVVGNGFSKWIHIALAVVLGYQVQHQTFKTYKYQVRTLLFEQALIDADVSLSGKRIALLNQHPSPYNQVILSSGGVRWTPQMNIAYATAELKDFDTVENYDMEPPPLTFDVKGRRDLHSQLLQLWEDYPPDVLIIDHTSQWPLRYLKFEWKQLLSQDTRFKAILDDYELKFEHDAWALKFEYYVPKN
jgi:hypothetical protein